MRITLYFSLAVIFGCPAPAPPVAPERAPLPLPIALAAPRDVVDAHALFSEALRLRVAGDDGAAKLKLDEALLADGRLSLARLERADVLLATGGDATLALADAKTAASELPDNPRA